MSGTKPETQQSPLTWMSPAAIVNHDINTNNASTGEISSFDIVLPIFTILATAALCFISRRGYLHGAHFGRGSGRYIIFYAFCFTILLNQGVLLCSTMTQQYHDPSPTEWVPRPASAAPVAKLGDGCYHVFLDVGSNIGMHVRFLYEPELYPKARTARSFFVNGFGPESDRDNRDVCVFSFEPNPNHIPRHAELQKVYASLGWSYHPIQAGVGHAGGNITFYHTGDDLGFTSKKSSCRKKCEPVHVPVIRLSDWIQREVAGRVIPQNGQYGKEKASMRPTVVMKLDIEMMEYEVLPDLMLSGALCNNIHAVMGEFHLHRGIAYLWRGGISFGTKTEATEAVESVANEGGLWNLEREEAAAISKEWLRMIRHNPNCGTKFSMEDDESYRNDGMPLPAISRIDTDIVHSGEVFASANP